VVVRYFGGTLLGVPGLINAYKTATIEAILASEIIEKTVDLLFKIEFGHPVMNEVMKVVKEENIKIFNQSFDLKCTFDIEIRQSLVNKVIGRLEKIEGLKWKA
jgi:putative IMPACT (imprinted ancient) family translation regulator